MINKKTMTLEQYNKKYRNRTEYLIKLKKSIADSYNNKFEHVVGNQYLFNGHKWQLIGDTYYQIPRCPSFTWFRNLHAGVQIAICVLLGGAIVGGAATPLILNLVNVPIVVDSNEVIFTYKKDIKGNINANIKTKDNTYEIKSIVIKTSDYEFVIDQDYTYDVKTGNIVIKSKALKEHEGKIHIIPAVTAIKVESVECERTLVVGYGQEKPASNLNVKVLPENAHDKTIKTYYVDGEEHGKPDDPFSIISDSQNPGKYLIHANKSGTATLTIVAGDTNAKSDCHITVLEEKQTYPYLTFKQIGTTDTCSVFLNTITDVPQNLVIPEYDPDNPTQKVVKLTFGSVVTQDPSVINVTLPSSIETIDPMVFHSWKNLQAVNFNGDSNLTSIGANAFVDCSNLEWFKISNKLDSIGNSAFDGCDNLRFILEQGNTGFSVSNDKTILFNKDKTKLISSPSASGDLDLSIYTSLSELNRAAFQGNNVLTNIKLPKSLKTVSEYSFNCCRGLKSVDFPDDSELEIIEGSAFGECKLLNSIVFPSSLKTIKSNAFSITTGTGITKAAFKDASKQWKLTKDATVIDPYTNISSDLESTAAQQCATDLKTTYKEYIWERKE